MHKQLIIKIYSLHFFANKQYKITNYITFKKEMYCWKIF